MCFRTTTRRRWSPSAARLRPTGIRWDDYFDKIYLSYELHELKPSEAIFRKVIADSGVIPSETLFIDDGRKNVDAAQALGFAVYMPAPGEDFGHLFEEITR